MASENVMEFTVANWQKEVLESDKPVLVDFWAPWCGPCRALAPTIDKVAGQFAGRLKVGKLNTDDNQDVAVKYKISAIPQVFLFKGGKEQQKFVGLTSERDLVKAVNTLLETN